MERIAQYGGLVVNFVNSVGRRTIDRIAAGVGALAFVIGAVAIGVSAGIPSNQDPTALTTTVSSPLPGGPVTMTVQTTQPPIRTNPPRITQETTVTEGTGPGEVVVTTSPSEAPDVFLGSSVAGIAFQVLLVTLTAILLGFGTQRLLLGFVGGGPGAPGSGAIDEVEAAAVKKDALAATETADLSRPLFDKVGVPDPRMRLMQSRIALELEVRKLAQHHDLPSGLTIPYVVRGLVEKKKMSPKLAASITALTAIGDRLSLGAEISTDTTTLLTDAYAQALAKVGGKIK
ncbi:hypothetical protein BH10ACT7_BH10ACT7_27600 [soil metagenome]